MRREANLFCALQSDVRSAASARRTAPHPQVRHVQAPSTGLPRTMRTLLELLKLLQLASIRDRVVGRDRDVERHRLVSVCAHFDVMRSAVKTELLKQAVEVIDDADQVAIDVDLRLLRRDFQPDRSRTVVGGPCSIAGVRVPRIVVPAVEGAVEARSEAEHWIEARSVPDAGYDKSGEG